MDSAMLTRMHAAALRHAASKWLPDPALSAEDLAQAAWLKALPRLTAAYTEAQMTAYLLAAVGTLAIDSQRTAARRPRGEFGEWLPSPQRVEDEAIASVELAPIVDRAVAGDRATVALVALGMGYRWSDVMAGLGVSHMTVWRWCCERQEMAL